MEQEKLPYLTKEETIRLQYIIYEIEDALVAIKTEVDTREKPYKGYLDEKLRTLEIDVPCIRNMLDK